MRFFNFNRAPKESTNEVKRTPVDAFRAIDKVVQSVDALRMEDIRNVIKEWTEGEDGGVISKEEVAQMPGVVSAVENALVHAMHVSPQRFMEVRGMVVDLGIKTAEEANSMDAVRQNAVEYIESELMSSRDGDQAINVEHVVNEVLMLGVLTKEEINSIQLVQSRREEARRTN